MQFNYTNNLLPLFIIIPILFIYFFYLICSHYNYTKNFRNLFRKNFNVFDKIGGSLIYKSDIYLVMPKTKGLWFDNECAVALLLYSNNVISLKLYSKELLIKDLSDINIFEVTKSEKSIMRMTRFIPLTRTRGVGTEFSYGMSIKMSDNQVYYFAIEKNLYDLLFAYLKQV